MDYIFRFAQQENLYFFVPLFFLLIWWRVRWYRPVTYRYSLASDLLKNGRATKHHYKKFLFVLRLFSLGLLVFLLGKPQLVDTHSKVTIDGIDIVLVLDISGSMEFQDFKDDKRSRVEIAKDEAVHFINRRDNDAIGLVVFGADALSRCPLTHDKNILREMVHDLRVGTVDPDGTVLATAMMTAASRLKKSKAKSKVMILLTDGDPSEQDSDPRVAIEVAKQLGIKVYTVGIGSDRQEYIRHPFYGAIPAPRVNSALLEQIAKNTGGRFFMARSKQDMRAIYDTIDTLEKTEHETPIFSNYHDIFMPFLAVVIGLSMFELLLSSFVWFSL